MQQMTTRDPAQFAALRARLADDRHRPHYHYLPPANWMNDPNGTIQIGGTYHLFYQHFPDAAQWGPMHWGHATSRDLVHWEDLPIALAPTPGGPDTDGCWSGCAVNNDGVPTFVYSGNRAYPQPDGMVKRVQSTCIATSDDGLRMWQKHPANPVISGPPPELDTVQYRDPAVWREGDEWLCVTGSGIRGVGGTVLLYRSKDLVQWDYLGALYTGDVNVREPVWTGPMWECPQFFALDGTHVLVISVWDSGTKYVAYYTGDYADYRFTPRTLARFDAGDSFYAPQAIKDDQGRRIMWGWLRERRSREAQVAAGWSGVMSLPRILTATPDGTLHYAPAPELETLRAAHTREPERVLNSEVVPLPGVMGEYAEVRAEFAPGNAQAFGLLLRRSPDGAEETRLMFEPASGRLTLDRSRSGTDAGNGSIGASGAGSAEISTVVGDLLPLAADEPLTLRVFLDGSAIEVFANERLCLSERVYPSRPDSTGVAAFAEGGSAMLYSLDCWQMRSIW